jgi:signal transduction histidine kinase
VGTFTTLALEQIRAHELELEVARLRERERLASRLHDSVAQRLFAIGAVAQASRGHTDPARLLDAIEEIETTSAEARRELRETLLQLHRDSEDLAFDVQLDGELRLLEKTTGCSVQVTRRGSSKRLPDHVARLVIDTAIEGIRNAAKHAHARLVVVEIVYNKRSLSLTVEERIVARSPEPSHDTSASGTGTGMYMLRTRAERFGGSLELTRISTGRAVLRLELPCNDTVSP